MGFSKECNEPVRDRSLYYDNQVSLSAGYLKKLGAFRQFSDVLDSTTVENIKDK